MKNATIDIFWHVTKKPFCSLFKINCVGIKRSFQPTRCDLHESNKLRPCQTDWFDLISFNYMRSFCFRWSFLGLHARVQSHTNLKWNSKQQQGHGNSMSTSSPQHSPAPHDVIAKPEKKYVHEAAFLETLLARLKGSSGTQIYGALFDGVWSFTYQCSCFKNRAVQNQNSALYFCQCSVRGFEL